MGTNSSLKNAKNVVPTGWIKCSLFELCDIFSGGTPTTKKKEYWDGDIPWCVPTDITASKKYISKTEKCITKKGLDNSSATLMPPYSILMCSRATIGPRCINTVPMSTNQGFKNLICKNKEDTEFVYYLLGQLVSGLLKKSNGSTFLELSKSELGNSTIAIPSSLQERKKIAQILMKWDEAVELQEKYIEKLKQYKAICLQKMFPRKGETVPEWRFKGFTDPWEQRKLDEIVVISKGEQINKAKLSESGSYYVLNGGMSPSGYTNAYNTKASTISISEGGNSCGYVAYNASAFWSGGHNYTLLQPKINVQFLYQCLKRQETSIMALRVGSGLPNIQKNRLCEVVVSAPNEEEQILVANCLSKVDDFITLHQHKLESIQEQRKAMQQLLLTGIVRVK